MPHTQADLKELVGLFEQFERHRTELAGAHSLKKALAAATDLLLDQSQVESHEQIRRLVAMWFERVCNWQKLARSRNPRSYESMRLQAQNIELFDEPLFQLPRNEFDDDGLFESVDILIAKPEKTWTAADRQRVAEFSEKLAKRRAERNEKK